MSSSIIKKNLPLFVVIFAAGAVSLVLLVFVIIQIVELREYQDKSNKALKDGEQLVRSSSVSPGSGNESLIKADIEIAVKAGDGLQKQFRNPLQAALDEFFKVLQPPVSRRLSESQIEAYKVPGTGEEITEGDKTRKVPLKIRRLTQQEFVEFFNAEFDKYCENKYDEDRKRNDITTLNNFKRTLYLYFPEGNFENAMNAFVAKAKTLTSETIGEHNQEALLLYALGMTRRVSYDPKRQAQNIDSIIETIRKNALDKNLKFDEEALFFGGKSSDRYGDRESGLNAEDYQISLIHWDIIGDIFKRIGAVQAASVASGAAKGADNTEVQNGDIWKLSRIVPRVSDSTEDNERGGFNFANSFVRSDSGKFLIYHYTLEFYASMDGVRKVLQELDQAYKEDRTYIVRSVCLYANDQSPARIMGQIDDSAVMKQPESDESVRRREPVRRRRSRRSRRQAVEQTPEITQNDDAVQHGEADAHLPVHERRNYGLPLIGNVEPNTECRVFLDVDYVVLAPNQNQ